jgi:hypothetical protein
MGMLMVSFAMSRKRKHVKQLCLTEKPSVDGWTESVRSGKISLSFVVFFYSKFGGGRRGREYKTI